jgi:hypothetical protein
MPDFKTIADFRKDNGQAIRSVCREFIVLRRDLKLFSEAIVAIDGSKFKAVNNRDKNFTDHKLKARMQQPEESIARYMSELDRADREPVPVTEARVEHIKQKVETVRTNTTPDRRAPLRYPQGLDGGDAFSDQDIATREYRDEFACTCLQPETSDADPRNRASHVSDQGSKALFVPNEVASHEASWRCRKPVSAVRQQCRRPSRRRANCVTPQEGGKKQDCSNR